MKLNKILISKEAECFDTEYTSPHTQMHFKCKYNHEWLMAPAEIFKKDWCPYCKDPNYVYTALDEMHKYAEKHGGKCVSKLYKNNHEKLEWLCANNHKIERTWRLMKKNNEFVCDECNYDNLQKNPLSKVKFTYKLSDAIKFAEERGGKCLSDTYVNNKTPLDWVCKANHQFTTSFYNARIKWCTKCKREGL